MSVFSYQNGQLGAEGVLLADVAVRYGTPCYVYSRAAIEQQWRAFDQAFSGHPHLVCYAVKANSSLAVLNVLARLGSGFDIVSGGELERVIRAGGDPARVVFSGVGKRRDEMEQALRAGIRCFNVESVAELQRLAEVAAGIQRRAPVSLRVNPDVDVNTHPYIATGLKENKFGIPFAEAVAAYQQALALPSLDIVGIDCHIGSQITSLSPFVNALERLLQLVTAIEQTGITFRHVDIGGGLGIHYQDETPPTAADYANAVRRVFAGRSAEIIIEPGRSIVGNAGVLLTRVEYVKKTPHKNFAIVDAAMNDLLRPSLYDAWHDILPVIQKSSAQPDNYDIVGPVCESSDFLGRDRKLALQEGELLAIVSAGAYGFSMSSTYNTRPRACEIMIDKDRMFEIRRRETVTDLMAGEVILPA